jgi:alkylated DNA nucleotide flippase Atl1
MNHLPGSAASDQDGGFGELKEPSPDFVAQVLAVVRAIPPGFVMTYGDVAAKLADHDDLAGMIPAYGARLVGQVMARAGADVAWWRVVRSTGQPPKFHEARAWPLYLEEGTPVAGTPEKYRIDLKRARLNDDQPRELRLF